ncbi:MAG TPA: FAD:protein FMN transferase [Woeseiaceae bacterium]
MPGRGALSLVRREGCWLGEFTAMASPCQVLSKADRAAARRQLEAAAAEAWRIEAKFSRYRDGNVVARINAADGGPVAVDDETAGLLDFAAELYRLSGGRFDITSGVLREVWTFDGSDRLPAPSDVRRVLTRVGWNKVRWERPLLTLAPGMQIDLGGIGKEYAVDRAAALAAAISQAPCLVNFGGDLAAVGEIAEHAPWRVGIEALDAAGEACRRIDLARGGLATSGDSRRFLLKNGIRYGHVLDPRTGWPVTGAPRSVTVAADTCSEAGMLATFALLMGGDAEIFLSRQSVRYWALR